MIRHAGPALEAGPRQMLSTAFVRLGALKKTAPPTTLGKGRRANDLWRSDRLGRSLKRLTKRFRLWTNPADLDYNIQAHGAAEWLFFDLPQPTTGIITGMQNITITDRERDAVLAALRYYQFYRLQGHPFSPYQDHLIDAIASESGEALDIAEIDDLCAGLNGNDHALAALASA
ncbi:hypothetical protein MKK54_07955 [Methylobacterium sp. J-068]|nr:hypothetical protein [Methylobacterium sp. J-068]